MEKKYWIGLVDGQPLYKDRDGDDLWLGGSEGTVIIPLWRDRKKAQKFVWKAKNKKGYQIKWTKTVECEVID